MFKYVLYSFIHPNMGHIVHVGVPYKTSEDLLTMFSILAQDRLLSQYEQMYLYRVQRIEPLPGMVELDQYTHFIREY